MMYFSYIGREEKKWKYMLYAFIAYAVVFGLRYGVGVDFFNYLENYQTYITSEGKWGGTDDFELGFELLTEACAFFNLHYSAYFGIIAFIQCFFTFLAFKEDFKIYPFLIFTFMVGCSWLTYSNGLRQIIVVSIWIYAVKMIAQNKVIAFYTLCIISILFHNSAAILFLLYPIFRYKNDILVSIRGQLLLLGGALIIMNISFVQSLLSQLDTLIELSGYGAYRSQNIASLVEEKAHIGIGFIITLSTIIILIFLSKQVKEFVNTKYYNIIYNLFVIGFCLKYIFLNSQLFSRINYYFINVTFIVAAYTIRYAHQHNKKLYYALLGLYGLTFIATLSRAQENTALYIFCWQDDLFHLK